MPATARLFTQTLQLPTLVHAAVDIADYLYLAEVVARKYYRGHDPIRDTELFSVACQELVKCGEKYDPSVGPFDRFAMRSMRNGIIHDLRLMQAKKRAAEFEVLADQDFPERSVEPFPDVGLLPGLLQKLPDNDRCLIEDYFLNNNSVADLANRLAVTKVTVYNRIDRILKKLREELLNVHNEG